MLKGIYRTNAMCQRTSDLSAFLGKPDVIRAQSKRRDCTFETCRRLPRMSVHW